MERSERSRINNDFVFLLPKELLQHVITVDNLFYNLKKHYQINFVIQKTLLNCKNIYTI